MKFAAFIASAFLAIATFATDAKAIEVNFDGASVNMSNVQVGQFGTITNIYETLFTIPPNEAGSGEAYGFLPSNTQITLNYTLNGLVDGTIQGYGSYNYNAGGNSFFGSALADSDGTSNSEGTINGIASLPLVATTADLALGDPTTGTITITNTSGSFASFQALFFGVLALIPPSSGSISYAVSAVPLPAALPLFGAMIAGLFGFARARRKGAAA